MYRIKDLIEDNKEEKGSIFVHLYSKNTKHYNKETDILWEGYLKDIPAKYKEREVLNTAQSFEDLEKGINGFCVELSSKKLTMPVPQLRINKFHWVAVDGLPEDEFDWCILLWKCHDGELDMHVGSYFKERDEFYVNFGSGGSVLDSESVVGWCSFSDCTWDMSGFMELPEIKKYKREETKDE